MIHAALFGCAVGAYFSGVFRGSWALVVASGLWAIAGAIATLRRK